jgi:hypothetical protein
MSITRFRQPPSITALNGPSLSQVVATGKEE